MALRGFENLACVTLLWLSEKVTVPQRGIPAPKTYLYPTCTCTTCTTTSSRPCLNSSHLLFLVQICTSLKADLELRKIEQSLGVKFYLKKKRWKEKKKRWRKSFSAICFQPPIFSSICNSITSVLFTYWHSCGKGKKWPSLFPVCLPRKYSIAFTACQSLFSWGAIMWHTHPDRRYS